MVALYCRGRRRPGCGPCLLLCGLARGLRLAQAYGLGVDFLGLVGLQALVKGRLAEYALAQRKNGGIGNDDKQKEKAHGGIHLGWVSVVARLAKPSRTGLASHSIGLFSCPSWVLAAASRRSVSSLMALQPPPVA